MNDDKLPNYYNVTIEARQCTPQIGLSPSKRDRTFEAKEVEANDPQTAVKITLNNQWGNQWGDDCDIVWDGWNEEVWNVFRVGVDDGTAPYLELDIEDYGDFATAVAYERRLRLAGFAPMGFVQ